MKTVQVVEDSHNNRPVITYAPRRADHETLVAGTDEEGVEVAVARRLPFVITAIPIVAITSCAMRGDREQILAAGCSDHFEKSLDPLNIVGRIHNLTGVEP